LLPAPFYGPWLRSHAAARTSCSQRQPTGTRQEYGSPETLRCTVRRLNVKLVKAYHLRPHSLPFPALSRLRLSALAPLASMTRGRVVGKSWRK
jgi:hypothetical protein